MILGTYWYYEFPEDLYSFQYFEFKKGTGGHASDHAELTSTFQTKDKDQIINELKKLADKYPDIFLFIYVEREKMRIGTGGFQLFDYDFLIIKEVEKILSEFHVILSKNDKFIAPKYLRISSDTVQNETIYPTKGFLQLVGSELKKHHAENIKLRLDCNCSSEKKRSFIDELNNVADEELIDVLFYYDYDIADTSNLMLFFTNGRQGLNLIPKKHTDIVSFENKIEKIALKYDVKYGHIKRIDFTHWNGPKIKKMKEQEFIL